MTADTPTIVFIAGSGRSGSTLVERMLGEIHGFVNVGELIDIFRRVHAGDELCGCGERFSLCAFWREVGDRAFGGWNSALVVQMSQLQARVARQRHIPQLLSPFQRRSFQDSLAAYQDQYAKLYKAIALTAGARVVVDASKWPAQALALSRGPINLRVIHVVRDVRGVAWSMNKRDLVRPHAPGEREVMFHQGVAVAAARWAVCQSEVDAVRLSGTPTVLLPYETLAGAARSAISHSLDELDLTVADDELGHLGSGEAYLGSSHGLSGNPSRFTAGVTPLRLDEEWREKMPPASQALLAVIGTPHRVRTRWIKRARRPIDHVTVDGS